MKISLFGANLQAQLVALRKDMPKAAENLEFEEEARLRDEIRRLEAMEIAVADDLLVRQSAVEEAVRSKGRSKASKPETRWGECVEAKTVSLRRRNLSATLRDPRYCQIVLDANALDRVDEHRSALVDEFVLLENTLPLSVIKPHGVEKEVGHPKTPSQVKRDMRGIYTIETGLTPEEIQRRENFRKLMTGNATSGKHIADADHLFEASKYGAGYFVTHEKRIHNRKSEVSNLVPGLEIVTLKEMIEICRVCSFQ